MRCSAVSRGVLRHIHDSSPERNENESLPLGLPWGCRKVFFSFPFVAGPLRQVPALFEWRMSYRRLDSLLALARKGYWVQLKCACGHTAQHNPMVVVELISQRGGSVHLNKLRDTMKCSRCGGKDFTAEHCMSPAMWSDQKRD